jgi:hypothetical protein
MSQVSERTKSYFFVPRELAKPEVGAVKKSVLLNDPEYGLDRLESGEVFGVLVFSSCDAQVGEHYVAVNKDDRLPQSWGVVTLRKGVQFPSGARAVEVLGDKVCARTAEAFKAEKGAVWFHPTALVERRDPAPINHASKAVWSRAYINDLDDTAFLHVEPGGSKDDDGKTVPRSLRHFPVYDDKGKLDLPHLRNAIARLPQAKIPGLSEADVKALQDRARKLLAEWRERQEKQEDKRFAGHVRELDDQRLKRLMAIVSRAYEDAMRDGDKPKAAEAMSAKIVVLAEMKRRGMKLPDGANRGPVDASKGLEPEDAVLYQMESMAIDLLAANSPAAAAAHDFSPAVYTDAAGAVRCSICKGAQTTSGRCNDPGLEAELLAKADRFEPMSPVKPPSISKSYGDTEPAARHLGGAAGGIAVEPLLGEQSIVCHKSGDKVRADGGAAGDVKESIAALEGDALLVGVLADGKLHVTDVLNYKGEPLGDKPWVDRAAKRSRMLSKARGALVNMPSRVAHGMDAVKAAVTWATAVKGSEGAVLKKADAGYSGAQTVAVVPGTIVNARVLAKEGETLRCGVALAPGDKADEWIGVKETQGTNYAEIGTVQAEGKQFSPGDIVRVRARRVTEVDKNGKRALVWIDAKALERVHTRASTVADVRAQAKQEATKKSHPRPIRIVKADRKEQYVLGVVLEPNDGADGARLAPDAHKDIYSKSEVRQACHTFLIEHGRTGLHHVREASSSEVAICENYLMPCDGTVGDQKLREGTWMLGAKVLSSSIWADVEGGELNAWSIDGEAARTPEAATGGKGK